MTPFQCIPIPTDVAERFRRSLIDDSGNALRSIEATDHGSFPCRHWPGFRQTRRAHAARVPTTFPGRRASTGPPSPIFIHEETLLRASPPGMRSPPIIGQGALISIRAYDSADQCIYDLGHVCAGAALDAPLDQALSDPANRLSQYPHRTPRLHAGPHRGPAAPVTPCTGLASPSLSGASPPQTRSRGPPLQRRRPDRDPPGAMPPFGQQDPQLRRLRHPRLGHQHGTRRQPAPACRSAATAGRSRSRP